MMRKFYLMALSLFVCASSFAQKATISKETLVEFEDTQARMLDVQSNAYFKPMVVELDMMPCGKVKKTYEFNSDKLQSFNADPAAIRSWATFLLSEEYDADVIVAATYDINYNSLNRAGSVTIVGFPAKFKNWHTMTDNDMNWILMEKNRSITEAEKIKPVVKK